MKSIKEALNNGRLKFESDSLEYEDMILDPDLPVKMDEKYPQKRLLNYYDGSITGEEHQISSRDWRVRELYDKYIFGKDPMLTPISDNDIDDLLFLRLTQSKESEYLPKFEKIMLRIFFEKRKEGLLGLALDIYDRYEWAKEYVKTRGKNDDLLFREGCPEYNRKYGVVNKDIPESETKIENTPNKTEDQEDWILAKFGKD